MVSPLPVELKPILRKCRRSFIVCAVAATNARLIAQPCEGTTTGLAQAAVRLDDTEYSFRRDEFVHPLIVHELLGWISDRGSTATSVDLTMANKSNRFHGEFSTSEREGRTWVTASTGDRSYIVYAHIATTPSGIELVECYSSGGGGGTFGDVAAFRSMKEEFLRADNRGRIARHNRIALTIVGDFALGDRYSGSVEYDGRCLEIGPDEGRFGRGKEAERRFRIP